MLVNQLSINNKLCFFLVLQIPVNECPGVENSYAFEICYFLQVFVTADNTFHITC